MSAPQPRTMAVDLEECERVPAYCVEWGPEYSSLDVCIAKHPDELREVLSSTASKHHPIATRLVVIHGLPGRYVEVLRDNIGLDAETVEAQAARRCCRSSSVAAANTAGSPAVLSLEYPELVESDAGGSVVPQPPEPSASGQEATGDEMRCDICGFTPKGDPRWFKSVMAKHKKLKHPDAATSGETGGSDVKQIVAEAPAPAPETETEAGEDYMDSPPRYALSVAGGEAAFCHLSVWTSQETTVLFLDRPPWEDPTCSVTKARRPQSVTAPCAKSEQGRPWDLGVNSGTEIQSLEQRLWTGLNDNMSIKSHDVPALVAEIAYDCWMEFFETVAPGLHISLSTLTWQIHSALEKNLQSSELQARHPLTRDPVMPNWRGLLDRLERRLRLISLYQQPSVQIQYPEVSSQPAAQVIQNIPSSAAREEDDNDLSSKADENSRSLNRVTYLGGILLPFTVVSGILSMSDDFAPGGSMFYVFWAVALPLTLVTLLLIYADSLRRLQVWIEVASEGQASDTDVEQGGSYKIPASIPEMSGAEPYSSIEPIGFQNRIQEPVEAQTPYGASSSRPGMMVHQRFKKGKPQSWTKEELGWVGAWKTILQLYRLQPDQRPPPGAVRRRRPRV